MFTHRIPSFRLFLCLLEFAGVVAVIIIVIIVILVLPVFNEPITNQHLPFSLRYILFNETYVGDKLLQKRAPKNFLTKQPEKGVTFESKYLVGDHEAIIDRDLWDRVQAKLTASTAQADNNHSLIDGHADSSAGFTDCADYASADSRAGSRGSNHKHPLYGKVICADCGSLMTRRTFRASSKVENRGDTYKVWTCKERYKGRKGNGCMMRHVKEEELLKVIQNDLLNRNQAGQSGQSGQEINTQEFLIEDSFADIDYIKVGQDEVTVIWKNAAGK